MKTLPGKTALGIGGILLLASLPGYATTVLDFDIVSGGGGATYTSTGGSFDIASLVYGTSTINIPSGDYLVLTYTTGASPTLTIANGATSDFSGVGAGVQLYSATTSLGGLSITGTETTGSGGSLNLNVTAGALALSNSNFFSDLMTDFGLTSLNSFSLAGTITGQYVAGSNEIKSDTIGITQLTATPEPSSLLLFVTGLAAIAAIAAKRRFASV